MLRVSAGWWVEAGLAQFEHANIVRVTYRSYVLNPAAPVDFDGSAREFLVRDKGVPAGQVQQMADRVGASAAAVGLVYDIDNLKVTNTVKAHQVLHFAKAQGRQLELADRLFNAFFAEGRHLGRDDVLADLAADVGLDRNAALAALDSGAFLAAVNDDITQARFAGITSVPSYLFNGSRLLSGMQPPETLTLVLNRLYAGELSDR